MSVLESLLLSVNNYFVAQVIAAALVVIAIKWLVRYWIILAHLPPGPCGLPVVGYALWMGKNAPETFVKLGKRYGGVFSINLGGETIVVLNDWQSIKASLVDQPNNFDGRSSNVFTWKMLTQRKDIVYHDGPIWAKERRLVMECLRRIGILKTSMEGHLMEAVQEISATLTKYDGKTIDMESLFFKSVLKLNWRLISSHNLEGTELNVFEKDINAIFKALRNDHPLNVFPWLRFLPPNGFGYKEFRKSCHSIMAHFHKLIDQHLVSQSGLYERDFVDHYLDTVKTNNAGMLKNNPPFDVEHLRSVMFDLFTGSVDTISSTCLWGFLYMAGYPEVQKKVQMEMDFIVGRQRLPCLADLHRLPYLLATIMEIHRIGSVGPMSIPHRVTRTSKIYNYTIPKDTTCIQNIYAVHHDAQLWKEPEAFRPERFLDEKNNAAWPPYLMPFSIGPRLCIGKDLAEMTLKLIFSCLLHTFTFTIPEDVPRPTFEAENALTRKPLPYSLHIYKRSNY